MGVFQIGFLLLNLTVPYFIWSNSTKKVTSTDSAVWEKSMARIVASDGGFPGCSVLQLVEIFRDLCDNSRAKLSQNTTVVMERASKEVVFACEAGKDFIRTSWRLEDSEKADLKCRDPSGDIIPHAPAFLFDLDGRLRAIEFSAASGERESIRMRSCREKLKIAKGLNPAPATMDDFFQALGRSPGDPKDYLTANFICFVFDLSPLWHTWRERYPR